MHRTWLPGLRRAGPSAPLDERCYSVVPPIMTQPARRLSPSSSPAVSTTTTGPAGSSANFGSTRLIAGNCACSASAAALRAGDGRVVVGAGRDDVVGEVADAGDRPAAGLEPAAAASLRPGPASVVLFRTTSGTDLTRRRARTPVADVARRRRRWLDVRRRRDEVRGGADAATDRRGRGAAGRGRRALLRPTCPLGSRSATIATTRTTTPRRRRGMPASRSRRCRRACCRASDRPCCAFSSLRPRCRAAVPSAAAAGWPASVAAA